MASGPRIAMGDQVVERFFLLVAQRRVEALEGRADTLQDVEPGRGQGLETGEPFRGGVGHVRLLELLALFVDCRAAVADGLGQLAPRHILVGGEVDEALDEGEPVLDPAITSVAADHRQTLRMIVPPAAMASEMDLPSDYAGGVARRGRPNRRPSKDGAGQHGGGDARSDQGHFGIHRVSPFPGCRGECRVDTGYGVAILHDDCDRTPIW